MFVNGSERNEQIYRGSSIDASYQVSVHLAKGFQKRRLKCEKLTDDKRGLKMCTKRILCGQFSFPFYKMGCILKFHNARQRCNHVSVLAVILNLR